MFPILLRPIVGDHIEVNTDWTDYFNGFVPQVQRIFTRSGVVAKSERWDKPDTFRLGGMTPKPFMSVISYERVKNIKWLSQPLAELVLMGEYPQVQFWDIASSKGNSARYRVTMTRNGSYHCTCKGFDFHKTCRHINEVKEYSK